MSFLLVFIVNYEPLILYICVLVYL